MASVSAAGDDLLYSTYLGGAGNDRARSIAVDPAGAAYVAGYTASATFPGTATSAIDASHGGGDDAFVTKLAPNGSPPRFSTYLGASGNEGADAIAFSPATGHAYITGSTAPGAFPVTAGRAPDDGSGGNGQHTGCLRHARQGRRHDPTGAAVAYSSLLGGSDGDTGFAIAVDQNANADLVGQANHYTSPPGNFPTRPGAFQASAPAGSEVLATRSRRCRRRRW